MEGENKSHLHSTSFIGLVFLGCIIIIGGISMWVFSSRELAVNSQLTSKPIPVQPKPNVTDLPITQVPPVLPQDIVLAKDAVVIHSYTAMTPDNKQQSTLIYQTTQAPASLLSLYTKYFTGNGWVATKDTTSQYALTASKSGQTVTVNVFSDAKSKQSVVAINMFQ